MTDQTNNSEFVKPSSHPGDQPDFTTTTTGYCNTELPDHIISIGIKNNEIISVTWGNLFGREDVENFAVAITPYLEKAVKFLKKKTK